MIKIFNKITSLTTITLLTLCSTYGAEQIKEKKLSLEEQQIIKNLDLLMKLDILTNDTIWKDKKTLHILANQEHSHENN